ncbi:SusD/RagB family nutrient-binding outer membrane lipoprotein [Pedobacter caeni]|uniref:Starch-binding associating with outer membrane n=1 Tax=Pedobacter caeni TaxID=288992 RepID=A0A1M5BSE8_9SPHI|nr:SusD/RagB family nutrient-binding outer membrane lipoprotein [Pedobacter caeni]SHF45162.1 Starch-binding associating with outer membrane [Pedobacter caeni]
MNIKKFIGLLSFILLFTACKKFDHYLNNPNKPTNATPALLLTGICDSVFNANPISAAYAVRHLTYYERPSESVNYNWNRADFGGYSTLRQVKKMEELGQGNASYQGLGKFFRALLFSRLTETFGDIPYRQSMMMDQGVDKPAYDTQEEVYVGILQDLEQANELLQANSGKIDGDIIYKGNIQQWKQLVNAFRLRILIHLSKREGSTKINIRDQFNAILSNPAKYPLMSGLADNGQIVYNASDVSNYYPTAGSLSVATLVSLEQSYVDLLKSRKDPRLFSIADPVAGQPAGVFESYNGVDAGLSPADQQSTASKSSLIARRYVDLKAPINEPMILLGYAEQEFLIAEGIVRGWASGNAETHYNNGITASLAFYKITGSKTTDYLNGALVKYDAAKGLEMILMQKYLAFFMNSGWEPFYEQRRTGIPTFRVGPGTLNGGKVPKRWLYPLNEFQYNKENAEAAVARQYPEGDNTNATMWLIK